MGTITIWALFALFGGLCARYVSVIGFALTALGIVALVALLGTVTGSDTFDWATLAGSFVAMQVGYFTGLVALALVRHVARLSRKDPRRVEEGDLHIKHD